MQPAGSPSATINVIEVLNSEGQSRTQIGNNYSVNVYNHADSSLRRCLADLLLTDPRDDKARIEQTKGGLLKDSYKWILQSPEYQQWRDEDESRVLWIKGDPGKGKTMMLCGILNELWPSSLLDINVDRDGNLSGNDDNGIAILTFFFCQATDSRSNTAVGVLRGLLFLILSQKPCLFSHLYHRYNNAGKKLFEGPNAFFSMSQMLQALLHDHRAAGMILVVDALDECETGLPELTDFITQEASKPFRVKWIISSRHRNDMEQRFCSTDSRTNLSLELNAEHVSQAVDTYINHKVSSIPSLRYNETLQAEARAEFHSKADGTFLWVSLALEELRYVQEWDVLSTMRQIPPGLTPLYDGMVEQIKKLRDQDRQYCQLTLSTVTAAYRPLHLRELGLLAGLPPHISHNIHHMGRISDMCGSFLTIRENHVYLVHQSAHEYLVNTPPPSIFPMGMARVHEAIFSHSLENMGHCLHHDMYELRFLTFEGVYLKIPDPDPLRAVRYSCVYWVDHLQVCYEGNTQSFQVSHGNIIELFLKTRYLYWLESLSLLGSLSDGILSLSRLHDLLKIQYSATNLINLVWDAYRFIFYYRAPIEQYPLQVYSSPFVFGPDDSLATTYFKHDKPKFLARMPKVQDHWGECLQTLEGHSCSIQLVAFSPDGTRLASASADTTIKTWDTRTGTFLRTIQGHGTLIDEIVFNPNNSRLVSVSRDAILKVWDLATGHCLQIFDTCRNSIISVSFFGSDLRAATARGRSRIKVWDVGSERCLQVLEGHPSHILKMAFAADGARLISTSAQTTKVWDVVEFRCMQTFSSDHPPNALALSHDSKWLATTHERPETIQVLDMMTGNTLHILKGHDKGIESICFTPDGSNLLSGSLDTTIKVWDMMTGQCVRTLDQHRDEVLSISASPTGSQYASASRDCTIKLWDAVIKRPASVQSINDNERKDTVQSVKFSPDGLWLWSISALNSFNLYDAKRRHVLQRSGVETCVLSPDGSLLAVEECGGESTILDMDQVQKPLPWQGFVAFSHDGLLLAASTQRDIVHLWNTKTGLITRSLEKPKGTIVFLIFSPDDSYLLTTTTTPSNHCISLWDLRRDQYLQYMEHISGPWYCFDQHAAFWPDSSHFAVLCNRTIKVFDTATCHNVGNYHLSSFLSGISLSKAIDCITFSPDSTLLAISIANQLEILDTRWLRGQQSQYPRSHLVELAINTGSWATTTDLAFSPDSLRLASAVRLSIQIWEVATGACLHMVDVATNPILHLRFESPSSLDTVGGTIQLPDEPTGQSKAAQSGYSISPYGDWIRYNSKPLIWIPPDYRPVCSAVHEAALWSIAFGTASGHFVSLELSKDVDSYI